MARNGSGTYVLPAGNPVITGTTISSSWANTTLDDVATALSQSISSDGQTNPTANLPMASKRHTGVGAATAATDYCRADQEQNDSLHLTDNNAMPSANVYTGTLLFAGTSFGMGQVVTFTFPSTNTGASTLNINASADWPIYRGNGDALEAGDCSTTVVSQLVFSGTAWLLINAVGGGGAAGVTSFNSRSGAVSLLSADVITALAYTPVNPAAAIFTAAVTLAGNASSSLHATPLQQVQAMIASIPSIAGVSSFNTRTGAVTLISADVTGALGFSPVASFNTRTGAVTLLSADVTTALGFTPQTALGTFSYVFATKSANTSPSGGSAAQVTYTNEITDVLSEYNTGTSRFTASLAGTYDISASVSFEQTAGATRNNELFIYKNGSALLRIQHQTATIGEQTQEITATLQLAASDYIEIFFKPEGAGTIFGGSAPYRSALMISRKI